MIRVIKMFIKRLPIFYVKLNEMGIISVKF